MPQWNRAVFVAQYWSSNLNVMADQCTFPNFQMRVLFVFRFLRSHSRTLAIMILWHDDSLSLASYFSSFYLIFYSCSSSSAIFKALIKLFVSSQLLNAHSLRQTEATQPILQPLKKTDHSKATYHILAFRFPEVTTNHPLSTINNMHKHASYIG